MADTLSWNKWLETPCFKSFRPLSLPISQPLQQGNDCVLFGWKQLQRCGYPAKGLGHPHLPPLAPLLSGLHSAASHLVEVGLLFLPLQNLLEQRSARLLLIVFLVLFFSSSHGCCCCRCGGNRGSETGACRRQRGGGAKEILCVAEAKGYNERWSFASSVAWCIEVCVASPAKGRGNWNCVCETGRGDKRGRRWHTGGWMNTGCTNVTVEDYHGLKLRSAWWVNGRFSHWGNGCSSAAASLTRWFHNTRQRKVPIRPDDGGRLWDLWFYSDVSQRTRQGWNSISTFVSFVADHLGANSVTECGVHQLQGKNTNWREKLFVASSLFLVCQNSHSHTEQSIYALSSRSSVLLLLTAINYPRIWLFEPHYAVLPSGSVWTECV